tara:strand:- start:1160 stop:2569 length:1410 start_codon:yes stop_codon:yes gene_type:complete
MKKKILYFATALFVFLSTNTQAQTYELLATYSASELATLAASFGIPSSVYVAEYGVNSYRLTYEMPYMGENIEVSGAMFIPIDYPELCDIPVHTYMHGTVFKRSEAPSFLQFEAIIGYLMGSPGYIVLMPDYVGLGTSELMHPYVHAESEADAGIYMMEALEVLGVDLGFTTSEQVFISGYSQGGHAAMAMAQEIEVNWSDEYTITACAPMSGPYDISGTQVPMIGASPTYSNPAYLAYNIIGWNSFYGNLYEDLSEIFQEPYASILPGLFDGETSGGDINAALTPVIADLLQPGVIEEMLNDSEHPFILAAQDNDVFNWIPETYMQLYYCTDDEQVFYENALIAAEWMTENGALHVTTSNGGNLDHNNCAGAAIFDGLLWMEQYREDCIPESVSELNYYLDWDVIPNPAIDGYTALNGLPQNITWNLRDISGRIIESGNGSNINLGDCSPGVYFIETEGHGTKRLFSK